MLIRLTLLAGLLLPMELIAAPCETLAKVNHVQVRESGTDCKQTELVSVAHDGTVISSAPYEEIPVGLEKFWVQPCACYFWQVSGIGGAHTRIVRFFREDTSGALLEVKGGVFGSEIGQISRRYRNKDLHIEVQDAESIGKFTTTKRYRLQGNQFVKVGKP